MSDKPRCDQCRWYTPTSGMDPDSGVNIILDHGLCRRYPPTFDVEFARQRVVDDRPCEPLEEPVLWMWPCMEEDDWCGEFAPIAVVTDTNGIDWRDFHNALSVRARKCLDREGITSMGGLLSWSTDDLRMLRNVGEVSLQEVREKLADHRLYLASVTHDAFRWNATKQRWEKP